MGSLLEGLAIIFFLGAAATSAVGAYEQFMFYRAWRRQRIESLGDRFGREHRLLREHRLALDAQFALFSRNLSEECRVHRRRLLWAIGAFFGFLALGTIALFGAYGPNPEKRQKSDYARVVHVAYEHRQTIWGIGTTPRAT